MLIQIDDDNSLEIKIDVIVHTGRASTRYLPLTKPEIALLVNNPLCFDIKISPENIANAIDDIYDRRDLGGHSENGLRQVK